jgi:hypothetical protein
MLNLGRRGRVRPRALSGLIGVHAALDAPSYGGPGACHGSKRVFENESNYLRQGRYVQDNDHAGGNDVSQRHERHSELRERRDALDSAEYDKAE